MQCSFGWLKKQHYTGLFRVSSALIWVYINSLVLNQNSNAFRFDLRKILLFEVEVFHSTQISTMTENCLALRMLLTDL